jgi:hypothetical protein
MDAIDFRVGDQVFTFGRIWLHFRREVLLFLFIELIPLPFQRTYIVYINDTTDQEAILSIEAYVITKEWLKGLQVENLIDNGQWKLGDATLKNGLKGKRVFFLLRAFFSVPCTFVYPATQDDYHKLGFSAFVFEETPEDYAQHVLPIIHTENEKLTVIFRTV